MVKNPPETDILHVTLHSVILQGSKSPFHSTTISKKARKLRKKVDARSLRVCSWKALQK